MRSNLLSKGVGFLLLQGHRETRRSSCAEQKSPFAFTCTTAPFPWTPSARRGTRGSDDGDFYYKRWVRQVWSQRWGMLEGLGWPGSPVLFLGQIGSGAGVRSHWVSSGRRGGSFKAQRELVVVVATERSDCSIVRILKSKDTVQDTVSDLGSHTQWAFLPKEHWGFPRAWHRCG